MAGLYDELKELGRECGACVGEVLGEAAGVVAFASPNRLYETALFVSAGDDITRMYKIKVKEELEEYRDIGRSVGGTVGEFTVYAGKKLGTAMVKDGIKKLFGG